MAIEVSELEGWAKAQDMEKLHQIMVYLDDRRYDPIRRLTVDALTRIQSDESLRILLTATQGNNAVIVDYTMSALRRWFRRKPKFFCDWLIANWRRKQLAERCLTIVSTRRDAMVIETFLTLLKHGRLITRIQRIVFEQKLTGAFLGAANATDAPTRFAALVAIAWGLPEERAVEAVAAGLGDVDVQIRWLATRIILRSINNATDEAGLRENAVMKRVMARLAANWQDDDFWVRAETLETLRQWQPGGYLDVFLKAMDDAHALARQRAYEGLASGTPPVRLIKLMAARYPGESSAPVRKAMILAAAAVKRPSAVNLLKGWARLEKDAELGDFALALQEALNDNLPRVQRDVN